MTVEGFDDLLVTGGVYVLLDGEPVCQAAGDVVPHHHLKGYVLALSAQLLALVQGSDIMGMDAVSLKIIENIGRYLVVHNSLLGEVCRLDIVEGGCHVLEVEDDGCRVIGRINPFFVTVENQ